MKSLFLLSALCVAHTFALKISIEGRHNHAAHAASQLARRGPLTGSSELDNSADITYYANITLNSKSYRVLIDTGSADLWVAGAVPNAVDSGHTSGVTYAIGAVKGPIKFADMKFAGYEVDRQAYLEISPSDSNPATRGLIGLGPVAGSNIWHELDKASAGGSFLDRVFLQHRDTPNYLTTLLGRHGDPTDIFDGSITIGEVLDEYKQILNEPKLPVSIVPVREAGDQHFQLLLDADAFIGPDGKAISAKTKVDETKDKNRLTAVVDTGFSLTQVPKSIADDIYSRISGAEFVNVTGVGNTWIVPCNQEVNLTMKIGGKEMKIHPLDVALLPERINLKGVVNSEGEDCCLGTFQPMVFNTGSSPNFDIILGMSFLRNVYTLHDFGDFIAGETDKREDPYLQFLSITEAAEAHSDFVTVRLAGTDTTDTQTLAPANSKSGESSVKKVFKDMSKLTIALIIGVICLVLAVLITIVALILRRKNRKGPVRTGDGALGKYQALQEPGQGGYGMQPVNNSQYAPQGFNPNAPYGDPNYQPPSYSGPPKDGYGNPWDARH